MKRFIEFLNHNSSTSSPHFTAEIPQLLATKLYEQPYDSHNHEHASKTHRYLTASLCASKLCYYGETVPSLTHRTNSCATVPEECKTSYHLLPLKCDFQTSVGMKPGDVALFVCDAAVSAKLPPSSPRAEFPPQILKSYIPQIPMPPQVAMTGRCAHPLYFHSSQ